MKKINLHKGGTDKGGTHKPKPGGPNNKSGGATPHTHSRPSGGKK